ncbi:MAG: phosphatidylserine decarboxylase family protein [Weeksellaceae bacterium]|nr:phosphatidylserine decarboxylase family protein [Weeksellaceae bacterium]
MRIHKEGIASIVIVGIATLIICIMAIMYLPSVVNIVLPVLMIIIFGLIVWFFRNPVRNANNLSNEIVAPVDGKVVVIEKVMETEFLNREVMQISIFMSPLNVHVCRYPVSGKVVYRKYHPGKYLVAFHPKSSTLNERTTVVVETSSQTQVLFRQIAGALARRIVLYAKEGDTAVAGTEYGFIKFGSRLDIFVPLDTEILCKLGDTTRGSEDVIARLKS